MLPYWALGQPIGRHCLYDLANDPDERDNRLDTPQEARMIDALHAALEAVAAPADQYERLGIG
jgi:hypothetical protein